MTVTRTLLLLTSIMPAAVAHLISAVCIYMFLLTVLHSAVILTLLLFAHCAVGATAHPSLALSSELEVLVLLVLLLAHRVAGGHVANVHVHSICFERHGCCDKYYERRYGQ